MKDPCLSCFVKPCCHEMCKPRILYSAIIYIQNIYKTNDLLHSMWNRNTKILEKQNYIQRDFVENLMNHYIKIIERKKQRNEVRT